MQLFSAFSLRLLKNQKKIKMCVYVWRYLLFFFFTCARLCSESPLRGSFLPLNLAIENLTVVLFLSRVIQFHFSPNALCVVCICVLLSDIRHTYEFQILHFLLNVSFRQSSSNITQGHDYLLVGWWLIIRAPSILYYNSFSYILLECLNVLLLKVEPRISFVRSRLLYFHSLYN